MTILNSFQKIFEDIVIEAIAESIVATERNPKTAIEKATNIINTRINKQIKKQLSKKNTNENTQKILEIYEQKRYKMIEVVTKKINEKYEAFRSQFPH